MTTAVESVLTPALSPAASAALGQALGDSPKVAALRAHSAKIADSLPLPSQRIRAWKYLDLSRFSLPAYAPVSAPAGAAAGDLKPAYGLQGEYGALAVQVDGSTLLNESRDASLVAITDFAGAAGSAAEVIDANLGTVAAPDKNIFTALHYAFLRGGLLVNVAANAEPAQVRIVRDYRSSGQFATPHTLIVTGANSKVSVIEDFRSADGDILVAPAAEIVPGPGSEVRYTVLHRWGSKTIVFGEQRTVTSRDSSVIGTSVATGGAVVKVHIEASLEGRGSASEMYGLCLGEGAQHADFFTLQDHIAPDTRSDLLFKSALKGESRSVYYGLTRVGLEAKNADANQENRNLLLSSKAKADSDPVLEILTNDVIRVSHGATAGPVDEEQLYYLQARGLSYEAAEALLVWAFLGQVLDRVPDEALREELGGVLNAKLESTR